MVLPCDTSVRCRIHRILKGFMVGEQEERKKVPWTRGIPGTGGGEQTKGTSRTRPAWSAPTRQVQGRRSEKKILKDRGAKIHPNSGAGKIKDDGSTSEEIIEVKDANKTFTVNAKDIRALRSRASQQGKQGVLIIKFPGFQMECRITARRDWDKNE